MTEQNDELKPAAEGDASALNSLVMHLSHAVARDIFRVGDESDNPCQRLEFKGGKWPETETAQGGLCEKALAREIENSICLWIGA